MVAARYNGPEQGPRREPGGCWPGTTEECHWKSGLGGLLPKVCGGDGSVETARHLLNKFQEVEDHRAGVDFLRRLHSAGDVCAIDDSTVHRGATLLKLMHPATVNFMRQSCNRWNDLGLTCAPIPVAMSYTRASDACLVELRLGANSPEFGVEIQPLTTGARIQQVPREVRLDYLAQVLALGRAGFVEDRAADPTNWLYVREPVEALCLKTCSVSTAERRAIVASILRTRRALLLDE